jgi:hypothetical protein
LLSHTKAVDGSRGINHRPAGWPIPVEEIAQHQSIMIKHTIDIATGDCLFSLYFTRRGCKRF